MRVHISVSVHEATEFHAPGTWSFIPDASWEPLDSIGPRFAPVGSRNSNCTKASIVGLRIEVVLCGQTCDFGLHNLT